MSKTPFMPLWVSDFLGDTLDLDAQEVGAYLLLLMAQWNRDGKSLPDDPKKLQRVARCGRNWPKVWGVIGRFFKRDEDGIYSQRLRQEAQIVAAKREVNSHNGARGGAAKALKVKDAPLANASHSLQRNASIPEPYPEPDKKEDMGKPISPADKPPDKMRLPDDWALSDEGWAYARSQGIPDEVIHDEAEGFHAYWTDRRDRDAKKSQRGWEQCWANRCRNIAGRYKGGGMAGKAAPGGYGQGSSIASIAARRRATGQV